MGLYGSNSAYLSLDLGVYIFLMAGAIPLVVNVLKVYNSLCQVYICCLILFTLNLRQNIKLFFKNRIRSSNCAYGATLFFYLGYLLRTFMIHRTVGEGEGYLINTSLQLPPASQTLRHYPGDYCRGLNSAHSQQPDSNREPLVSEPQSLTTKTEIISRMYWHQNIRIIIYSATFYYYNTNNSTTYFTNVL